MVRNSIGDASLFILKRPFLAFELYLFSRRLAAFGVQDLLSSLPLRFLTRRKGKNIVSGLPAEHGERTRLFLERSKTAERNLAFYLSLYPEAAGKDLARELDNAVFSLTSSPTELTPENRKRETELIKLFYALSLYGKKTLSSAEHFEKWYGECSDFRLEAAALERLNDAFYEDDFVSFVLPDWKATTKDVLSFPAAPPPLLISESPEKEKTAAGLVRTAAAMILRDGFMVIPSLASCRCDRTGTLRFIRAERYYAMDSKELRTVRNLAKIWLSDDPSKTAAVLKSACFLQDPALNALPVRSLPVKLSERIDIFFDTIIKTGAPVPFYLRYIACLLKETDRLCLSVLRTPAPWDTVRSEIASYSERGTVTPSEREKTAQDFKRAFTFDRHQREVMELRGKKLPAFQEDAQKIPEMLLQQTVGAKFKPKEFRFRPVFLTMTAFLIIIWLLTQIK